jgi:hypothetical protein
MTRGREHNNNDGISDHMQCNLRVILLGNNSYETQYRVLFSNVHICQGSSKREHMNTIHMYISKAILCVYT